MILILKIAFWIFAFGLFHWNVPYLHKSYSLGGSLPSNNGISHVLSRVKDFRAKLLFGYYSGLAQFGPVGKDLNYSSACLTPEKAEDLHFLTTDNSSVPEEFPEEEWKTEVLPAEYHLAVFNKSSFHNCSAGEAEEEWKTEVLPEDNPLPVFNERSFHNCSAGEAEEYVFESEDLRSLWKYLVFALVAVLFVTYPVMLYWICPQRKIFNDCIAEEPESPARPEDAEEESEVISEILTACNADGPILVADETIGVLNQCVKKKKLVKGKFYFMMRISEANCLSAEVLDNIIKKHKGAVDITTSFYRDRIYFTCASVEDEDRLPSIVEEIRLSIQKFRIQI